MLLPLLMVCYMILMIVVGMKPDVYMDIFINHKNNFGH